MSIPRFLTPINGLCIIDDVIQSECLIKKRALEKHS